jgi:hypothetical protein
MDPNNTRSFLPFIYLLDDITCILSFYFCYSCCCCHVHLSYAEAGYEVKLLKHYETPIIERKQPFFAESTHLRAL